MSFPVVPGRELNVREGPIDNKHDDSRVPGSNSEWRTDVKFFSIATLSSSILGRTTGILTVQAVIDEEKSVEADRSMPKLSVSH
jgi:hypothetical protein